MSTTIELYHAIKDNDAKEVASILERFKTQGWVPESVEYAKGQQMHVLHFALEKRNPQIIKLLLDYGANINVKDANNSNLLTILTSKPDHVRKHEELLIAEELIKRGMDVNAEDNFGLSPLQNAMIRVNKEMAELLIKNKASVDIEEASSNKLKAFTNFFEQCPDVLANIMPFLSDNIINKYFATITANLTFESFEHLLSRNFNLKPYKVQLSNLLIKACEAKNLECIDKIIEYGVDISKKSIDGRNPMSILFKGVLNFDETRLMEFVLKHINKFPKDARQAILDFSYENNIYDDFPTKVKYQLLDDNLPFDVIKDDNNRIAFDILCNEIFEDKMPDINIKVFVNKYYKVFTKEEKGLLMVYLINNILLKEFNLSFQIRLFKDVMQVCTISALRNIYKVTKLQNKKVA